MDRAAAIAVHSPVRVHNRIAAAPDSALNVVARGRDAIYLDAGDWCFGVVAPAAVRVPCAMVTAAPLTFETFEIKNGTVYADQMPLRVTRLSSHRVPRLSGEVAGTPPAVARLIGAGDGLTPYGDDVLCGWLGIQRAAGVATPRVDALIRANLANTTALSATLLECAMAGEVIDEFAEFVSALGTNLERPAVAVLKQVGGTSGIGLLEGARMALRGWTGRVAA